MFSYAGEVKLSIKWWLDFNPLTKCLEEKSNFSWLNKKGELVTPDVEYPPYGTNTASFVNNKKESNMKIKVKENLVVFDEKNKKQVELKAGTYDYSNNLVGGVCLTKEFIKNSSLFEIIEDWKPDPKSISPGLRYTDAFGIHSRIELSKKEAALRKLKQIANYLNGDWEANFGFDSGPKHFLFYDQSVGDFKSDYRVQYNIFGGVFFKEMTPEIHCKILDWMNNGDGVCMNDLLED